MIRRTTPYHRVPKKGAIDRRSQKKPLGEAFGWYIFNLEHDGEEHLYPNGQTIWMVSADSLSLEALERPVTVFAKSMCQVRGLRCENGAWSLLEAR